MTSESINAWVARHDVKILHGEGGTGLAREWDDYVHANGRRHLTVIYRPPYTLDGTAAAVREFCAMHKLPLP